MSHLDTLITDHLDLWSAAVRPKSSAGRGSNSKLELTGIKKLRELILELAVRGKLVPQDPSDEPASVLLERIAAAKARLVKEGKIKKPKALPEIGEEEKPFELPDRWQWCRLGSLIPQFQNGASSRGDSGGIPITVLRLADIKDWKVSLVDTRTLSIDARSIDKYSLEKDDILIIRVNGSSDIVGRFIDCDENYNAIYCDHFIRMRFLVKVFDTRYLSLLGSSNIVRSKIADLFISTAGQKTVNQGHISSILLPLPSIAEQQRIVAKVDELMALCDQLDRRSESQLAAHQTLVETLLGSLLQPAAAAEGSLTDSGDAEELAQNWARLSNHFDTLFTTEVSIDALKQTILQLAVMGKLVPQDPSDEPASALLERIAAEKARLVKEKKIKKEKPLPVICENEKPFELPQGWAWCRLPDLGELARGKSKHRPRNDPKLYVNGTIPLVQTGDVARADGLIESYTAMYNEIGLAQSQLWPKGTLCITIAANIADTGILGFDACFPDSVVGYTPYESSLPVVYFDFFIRTAKENLERFAPSTAQKNINLEILRNILVPCPPTQEFIRIVSRVNDLFAICDQLKSRLQTSQQTQLALAESLVAGALV